eukprot:PhF_6_TR8605/c0_g1_i1/m.13419/K11269/CTF18, CHL12; chromosome transmission fidelity protein 18
MQVSSGGVQDVPQFGKDCIMLHGQHNVRWLSVKSEEDWDKEIDMISSKNYGNWRGLRQREEKHNVTPHEEEKHIKLPSVLLAEKYRPRAYTELLSDEKCNLEVMAYFQLFQKNEAANPPAEKESGKCPLLLIVGPPGVGKTTLVHVIARHWGFTPVEINASSERSIQSLEKTLYSATASNVQDRSSCVIIEEMDGITQNAATNLLTSDKFLTSCTKPVVCVANDLYAPALRNFRRHPCVTTVVFPSVDEKRLAHRFGEIVHFEALWPAMAPTQRGMHLRRIAAMCDGDIRKGLNVLQFSLLNLDAATTDGFQPLNLFSTWKFVLQPSSKQIHLNEFINKIKRCQDMNVVLNGVFENYLTHVPPGDFFYTGGQTMFKVLEWFCLQENFGHSWDAIIPVALAAVHTLMEPGSRIQLQWPKRSQELYFQQESYRAAVVEFYHSIAPHLRTLLSLVSCVIDVIPIMQSHIASISASIPQITHSSMLTASQRQAVVGLAHLIRWYGINLPDGKEHSKTDSTSFFNDKQFPLHVNGLVREVLATTAKRDREDKPIARSVAIALPQTPFENTRAAEIASEDAPAAKPLVAPAPPKKRVAKDIFGREIVPKAASNEVGRVPNPGAETSRHKVKYKLVVATTSTVRRPAKVEEFL